jgi:hypothetical protein
MSHAHRLAVHRDGEGRGTHLRGDGRGLHTGSSMGGSGKSEKGNEKRTKTRQETVLRQESGSKTTLAPGA